jgi:hypothetical protein
VYVRRNLHCLEGIAGRTIDAEGTSDEMRKMLLNTEGEAFLIIMQQRN